MDRLPSRTNSNNLPADTTFLNASLNRPRWTSYASPRIALTLLIALSACGKSSSTGPSGTPPVVTPPVVTPPVVTPPTHETTVPTANAGFVEARTSQIVANGAAPTQVFDDFSFATNGTISTVGWQGIYCVQQANALAPAPTATSFTVSIYADAAGRPNTATALHTSTYPIAQTGQVLEKSVGNLKCGTAANTSWPFYRYSVTLPSPFTATAGTKYWISIQATTPSYDVFFGWRDGTPNNNSSLQLFQGTYTTYAIDRAYSLK